MDQFYQPAEWTTHQACWLAWPSQKELWGTALPQVQEEWTQFCQAIADPIPLSGSHALPCLRGELLEILVLNEEAEQAARHALRGLRANFHRAAFGDFWLRDTAPLFLRHSQGALALAQFQFNGWGQKYCFPEDTQVSAQIAQFTQLPTYSFPWVFEGGSIEVDGEGTGLTTRQCLLNLNRNPRRNQLETEEGLRDALGIQKVLWLDEGLINDHTDGHIDTVARFVAPGVVICMQSHQTKDSNTEILAKIATDLSLFKDAQQRSLRVIQIPSPGEIVHTDGYLLPASYVNFYISNHTVVVPLYGSDSDEEAVALIAEQFPTRRTLGLSARAILEGGGAFHCMTQQQPAVQSEA